MSGRLAPDVKRCAKQIISLRQTHQREDKNFVRRRDVEKIYLPLREEFFPTETQRRVQIRRAAFPMLLQPVEQATFQQTFARIIVPLEPQIFLAHEIAVILRQFKSSRRMNDIGIEFFGGGKKFFQRARQDEIRAVQESLAQIDEAARVAEESGEKMKAMKWKTKSENPKQRKGGSSCLYYS